MHGENPKFGRSNVNISRGFPLSLPYTMVQIETDQKLSIALHITVYFFYSQKLKKRERVLSNFMRIWNARILT